MEKKCIWSILWLFSLAHVLSANMKEADFICILLYVSASWATSWELVGRHFVTLYPVLLNTSMVWAQPYMSPESNFTVKVFKTVQNGNTLKQEKLDTKASSGSIPLPPWPLFKNSVFACLCNLDTMSCTMGTDGNTSGQSLEGFCGLWSVHCPTNQLVMCRWSVNVIQVRVCLAKDTAFLQLYLDGLLAGFSGWHVFDRCKMSLFSHYYTLLLWSLWQALWQKWLYLSEKNCKFTMTGRWSLNYHTIMRIVKRTLVSLYERYSDIMTLTVN